MQTHIPPLKMRWWLLKAYLRLHRWLHPTMIAKLAEPNFGGLHPSNVFHYRSGFFVENVGPQDRVVDIACGTGNIARALSTSCAIVYAIDRNETNLAIAAREHGAENIHYISADVLGYDYAGLSTDQGVNVAVLSHILEHIEDACAFLRRLNMPRLLICVPSQENCKRLAVAP